LIKNQIEQRLTNSWAASIRNALIEIQDINLKENKKSYYINQNEWDSWLEEEIELAIADAALEVMNGKFTRKQLSQLLNHEQLILTATELLTFTYNYQIKELPDIIDEYLGDLPGGEDWKLGKS
jgi:hypothetical protein